MNHNNSRDSTNLEQAIGAMILDSGFSRSVCVLTWYNCYLDTLPAKIKRNMKAEDSEATFEFGDGQHLKSTFKVKLLCTLAGKNVEICADVVESEICLLVSKDAMKKANSVQNESLYG